MKTEKAPEIALQGLFRFDAGYQFQASRTTSMM